MTWIIIIIVIVVLFYLITPNPAKTATISDDVKTLSDESVNREYSRVTRWLTHHIDASKKFKEEATKSGAHEKYKQYLSDLSEEMGRRSFVKSLITKIPAINSLEDFAYINLLNDGMMKIAWQMKKSGSSDHEIQLWISRELLESNDELVVLEDKPVISKGVEIINDILDHIKPIYLYKEDPIGLEKEEMLQCSIDRIEYTQVTFIANLAFAFRTICMRDVFSGSHDESDAFATGIIDKHGFFHDQLRELVLLEYNKLISSMRDVNIDEAADIALSYVVSSLKVPDTSIHQQFEKMYTFWHLRPIKEMLNNLFLQTGYRGLVFWPRP